MKMKLIMESFKANMGLAQSMGIGGNYDSESEAAIDPNARQIIHGEVTGKIEELGMDWILDDINDDLFALGDQSKSSGEYREKIKDYLNSKADDFGYPNLGDEVFGGDQVSTG
tara:strand:- start:1466 stop:1804 length:339 start_codon:yes stop_codon:yes gene_type:complete